MSIPTTQDLLASIKAAQALQAIEEILDALTELADIYIADGETQAGADVLAYILRCAAAPTDVLEHAQDSWDDLARYVCPRVLLDAEDFSSKAELADVVAYVFAGT